MTENIIEFISRAVKNWNADLMSCGEFMGKVNIRRGIFQGTSLFLLLLAICMRSPTEILRKVQIGVYSEMLEKVKTFAIHGRS